MDIIGIIAAVIIGVVVLIYLLSKIVDINRKRQIKYWQVGDKLLLYKKNSASDRLENNGRQYAKLLGWTLDYLYIDCGDDITSQVSWNIMQGNKSAMWRKNYADAKKIMGVEPGFPDDTMNHPDYADENTLIPIGKKFQGKDINLMTETECQVYLKIALDNEDYSTAELIRQRLEKFR